jgi:hypothetical protein
MQKRHVGHPRHPWKENLKPQVQTANLGRPRAGMDRADMGRSVLRPYGKKASETRTDPRG